MISKLEILDTNDTPLTYLSKINFFQNGKIIEFTDGLNILIGSNAIGKTSLLKLLAIYLHCEQGGVSTITKSSIQNLIKNQVRHNPEEVHRTFNGCNIFHDGQPTFYMTSAKSHGMIWGQFDTDFFEKGIKSCLTSSVSSGQKAINTIKTLIGDLENIKEIKYLFNTSGVNTTWKNMYALATNVILRPNIDKNKQTILIDEFDSGLDIINQETAWKFIRNLSKKYQVIIAGHGIFGFSKEVRNIANYIEFENGYLDSVLNYIQKL